MTSSISLRAPSAHTHSSIKADSSGANDIQPPTFTWLSRTWHVSYSTLPMWKGKQNVHITYSLSGVMSSDQSKMPNLMDHVESQKAGQEKVSHIHGISRPVEVESVPFGLAYTWRGNGLLKLISSNWEILGFGTDSSSAEPNDWAVTCFSKTLFTPAGIDIYTSTKASLSEATLEAIKAALAKLHDDSFNSLATSLFEVPRT
jgi:hypothetical protein